MTVLWSGTRTGDRRLVMPNEESMVVLPTVYFESSEDAFCNWTDETIDAGRVVPLEIGYNRSVSLMFSFNGSEVVYNVWTFADPGDYEPEDVEVSVAEYWAFAQEVGMVCAGFGVIFALAAIKVRSFT